ncbi:cytochrome P450 [Nocardia beijingensis]|uniref:cytochrome P450 n=1 Tax=Nocardia beijingensis TaxID=95162 RepID=UPI00189395C3|nr:cytochrome P450 [Nocardia beijingensis]MBF6467687.1 cytochrome P450 [Nocardia beijingensis]
MRCSAVAVTAFPFDDVTCNELPYAERDERYRRLHEWPEPSYAHRCGLRMIWKYADVREVLDATTPGISNTNSLDPLVGYARIAATPRAIPHFVRHLVPPPAKATANLADDRLHKRVWNTMAGPEGHFTISAADRPARAAQMAEHFHEAVRDAGFRAGSPLDVTALSIGYAARTVGAAVGLPAADWPHVAAWSGAQSGLLGRVMRGRELADAVSALGWLFTVSGRAVREGRGSEAAGFARKLRDAGLSHRIAVSAMANSLAAGVHTVSGSIQQGVQRLLADPDRNWWNLLTEPEGGTRVAAKILQLDPGLVAWKRRARTPVVLSSGTRLPAGPLLVLFAAANRDPAVFPDCSALDGPGKLPLTFGFGRHVCPGKSMATLAVEVFLRQLRELAPGAEAAPGAVGARRRSDLLFSGADITVVG